MNTLFSIRKENLIKIILDRHLGNKAAFSRAVGIHQNHVNLMASENPNIKRNMGEELARRIELAIGLPEGWMDIRHGDELQTININAKAVDASVSRVAVQCRDYTAISVTQQWLSRIASQITHAENLMLVTITTKEMAPVLPINCTAVVDTGAKAVSADGVYILTKGDFALIREVRRTADGFAIHAANNDYRSDKPEVLKGMKVAGRVITVVEDKLL